MTPTEKLVVGGIVAASAIGGALAHTHATATQGSDVVWAAAFAGLIALSCSIAQTWSWILLGGSAAVFSRGAWQVVGATSEALAIAGAVVQPPRRRIIGAAIGGLAAQSLVRLGHGPFMTSTALVAAAASVPVLVTAYRSAHSRTRDLARRTTYVVGTVAALATVAAVFSIVRARNATNDAVSHVEAGLDAARAGDTLTAGRELASAAHAFSIAQSDAGSWWTRPAELLPFVGQQVASVDRLTRAGEQATLASAKATSEADVNDFKLRGGQIDVTKVAAAEQPLTEVLAALHEVDRAVEASHTGWLVRPLATRIDAVKGELDRATSDAELALDAVKAAPALLGGDGPRHYFVAFGNPAESRDLGGFSGGYGELLVDKGKLTLLRTGRASDLNNGGPHALTDPDALPLRYKSFELDRFWQNITSSPDFPTVAEAVQQLWPESGGGPLDGVLYVDPYALAALLQLTGPITIPGLDHPLAADNLVSFLTRDQYTELQVNDERHDLLSDTARIVFDKLTSSDLPGPRQVADALGPTAQAGRLLLHSFHPDEQALFAELGIDGALAPADGDFLAVTVSNRGQNKIDSFLSRSTADDVTVDPASGRVDAIVRVTLRNDAPASGLPNFVIADRHGHQPDGTNTPVVSVMTPLLLDGATVDASAIPIGPITEYGLHTYSAALDIPAGATQVLELRLHGQLDLAGGYRLTAVPRPNVGTEKLEVTVTPAGDASIRRADGLAVGVNQATSEQDLSQRAVFRVLFSGS